MNYLFDVGHPAHVHLFRCFAREMQEKGDQILFTSREKDMTIQLLKEYKLPYVSFGKPKKGVVGKVLGMLEFNLKLLRVARRFKPDYLLSHGSLYAAHVSAILRKPHISFEDTGNMEQIVLYKPFTEAILVSDSFSKHFGKKTVVYPGYHELAYLHPKRFTPDPEVIRSYGFEPGESLILIRFVSWGATHDINHAGMTLDLKIQAAKKFSQYGKVLITSEAKLPPELEPYQIKINPIHIFHFMAHASLVFGESGTMASEAAVLGVPAIYIDSTSRDYTQEQERKYGLVFNFSETERDITKAIQKGEEILSHPEQRNRFAEGHKRLLADKLDVTAFLKDFVDKFDVVNNQSTRVSDR